MRPSAITAQILAWTISLGLVSPTLAGGPTPDKGSASAARAAAPASATARGSEEPDGEWQDWSERLALSERRVRETRSNAQTARSEYRKARARKYPRGKELQALEARADSTLEQRDDAEAEFSALVDSARRAGVLPGALTPFEDLQDEIQQLRAERASRGEN